MKKMGLVAEIIFYYVIPVIFIGSYVFTSIHEINYGLNRDYAEGTTLSFIEKSRSSDSPRHLYSEEAFSKGDIVGYPVFHLGLVASLSHDAASALQIGRIISILCGIAIGAIAWWILFSFGIAQLKHLPFVATLILYQSAIFDWSLLARADLLAALFEVLGLALFAKSLEKEEKPYWAPLTCFVLAFLCKQNFIAGPLIVLLWELRSNAKRFLKSSPPYIGFVLIVFLLITWGLGFSYWKHTVLQLGEQQFYLSRLMQTMSSYLLAHLWIIIPALVGLWGLNSQKKSFILFWIAFSFSLALIGMGRSGSNVNYFISLSIPLSLLAFVAFKEVISLGIHIKSGFALLVLAAFLSQSYFENHSLAGRLTYLDHRSWPPSRPDPTLSLANTKSHLESYAAKNVFCDEPGICTLLGYSPKYAYFENQMNTQAMMPHDLLTDFDTLLFTEYPSEHLAWTKFKLPAGAVNLIQQNYELRRISDMGFIFTRKQKL